MIHTLYILAATKINSGQLPQAKADSTNVEVMLQVLFGFIGAIALLIIVVSGFRYILSGGEPEKTAKAKNGIIYAAVGLVVAISAQAIVTLVVQKVGP